MGIAYIFFKIVDEIAIKFGIEVSILIPPYITSTTIPSSLNHTSLLPFKVLKSGVYTDKNVPVDHDDEFDPDEFVNFQTWFI